MKGILDPLERVIKVNKEYHQVYQWLVFYLCFTGGNWTWLRLRRIRKLSKKNIFDLFIGFLTPLFCPGNDWKILNKHPTQPKVLGISMSSLLVIHQPWEKKMHAESGISSIFGTFRKKESVFSIKWPHNFSIFSRMENCDFVPGRIKQSLVSIETLVSDLHPIMESSLF